MDTGKRLAKKLSAQRNQPEVLWSVAVGKAASLVKNMGIGEEQVEQLASACRSPRQLLIIVDYAAKQDQGENVLSSLTQRVDESPYSLTDWLDAIECIHDHLENEGRSTTLEVILGYVSCCTEANPNTPHELALIETVKGMLDQFGFDG